MTAPTEQDIRDRISYAELQAYRRGYESGRADASVWNAILHDQEQAELHWRTSVTSLNEDRRDHHLLRRLRDQLAQGKPIGFHDNLILYLADHPEVRFRHDPGTQPHGAGA